MAKSTVVPCSLCGYLSPNLPKHVSHVRHVHKEDCDLKLPCCFGECKKNFQTTSAFSTHVYRYHREEMDLSPRAGSGELRSFDQVDDSPSKGIYQDAMIDSSDNILAEPGFTFIEYDPLENKKMNAKFLLKLTEGRRLTQVALSDVIQGCRDICARTAIQVKQNITASLTESGMDSSVIDDKQISMLYEDPFDGLTTPYIRHKFIEEHFNYVVSDHCRAICTVA